jgi:hypothetical protein
MLLTKPLYAAVWPLAVWATNCSTSFTALLVALLLAWPLRECDLRGWQCEQRTAPQSRWRCWTTCKITDIQLLVYEALSDLQDHWYSATSALGFKRLMYETLSFWCMRPYATCNMTDIKLLVQEALSYSVEGLKLLVYEALSYLQDDWNSAYLVGTQHTISLRPHTPEAEGSCTGSLRPHALVAQGLTVITHTSATLS